MKNTSLRINSNIENMAKRIRPVLIKHSVIRASLFGSYVRGENTKTSDVDVLVELKKGKSLMDLVDLELELKSLLKRDVDVLTYRSVHPLLRKNIISEQKVIL